MSKTIYDRVLHVRIYFCLYERGSPTPKAGFIRYPSRPSNTLHNHAYITLYNHLIPSKTIQYPSQLSILSTTMRYPLQLSNTLNNHPSTTIQYLPPPSNTLYDHPILSTAVYNQTPAPPTSILEPLRPPRILCDCLATTHCARPLQYGV